MIQKNEIDSEFIEQLKTCFTKYDFIYIDDAGDLHLLIPITRALIIHGNLTGSQENPTLLAYLGDNTCETFGEMRSALTIIKANIPTLTETLKNIKPKPGIQEHHRDYYIALLEDYTQKIFAFEKSMADTEAQAHTNAMMKDFDNDKASLFACRLNCILKTKYDNVRPLAFPNILLKAPDNLTSDIGNHNVGPERARLFHDAFTTQVKNAVTLAGGTIVDDGTLTTAIVNLAKKSLPGNPSEKPPGRFIKIYNSIPLPTIVIDQPNFHLFMIQSFFYLIFVCLKPTDPQKARVMLGTFVSDPKKLLEVITKLFAGDDNPLKTWLKLDDEAYNLILESWESMCLQPSPHYDEIKIIYTQESVKNSTYFLGRSPQENTNHLLYMTINPVSHWNSSALATNNASKGKDPDKDCKSRVNERSHNFDQFCQRGFSTAVFAPPSLLYAIKNKDCETIQQLINEAPSLLNKLSCDNNAYASLHYAVCNDGDTLVINTLLELAEKHKHPINIALSADANTTPLDLACRHENIDAIKILLPLHSKAPFSEYPKSQHPLFLAIREGKPDAVMTIIETDETLLNLTDEHNKTTVFTAAEHKQHAILSYLIQKKAAINTPCHSPEQLGMTPLDIAISKNHVDIIALLKENNAKSKDDPQLEDLELFKEFKDFFQAIKEKKSLDVKNNHLGFFTTNKSAVFERFQTAKPYDLIDLLCASFLPDEISVEEVTLLIAILLLCHQKKPLNKEAMEQLNNSFLFISAWPSPLDQQVQTLEESLSSNQPMI